MINIEFLNEQEIKGGITALCVEQGRHLTKTAMQMDKACHWALSSAMKNSFFNGKKDEILDIIAPFGLNSDRILLFGFEEAMSDVDFRQLGANLFNMADKTPANILNIVTLDTKITANDEAEIAYGILLASYRFNKYLTVQKGEEKAHITDVKIYVKDKEKSKDSFADHIAIAKGVFCARDLVSEPPNILHPESFADECLKLKNDGIDVTILGEDELKKLGFNALLGVGQGSSRESRVAIMQWKGDNDKGAKPLAFIGKGVTFDTGGISLKPGPGMEEMKWDMAGAGVVTGLMKSLALRKARVNAVGIVGLVENMPDGAAQRPGDIVKTYSGKTVEIHNTDAEGRLVLADILWYCQEKYDPALMIDLATLTGAIIISLGNEHAGLFSNDDILSQQLTVAGNKAGEKLWRMPLHANYAKLLKTSHADMKNIGGKSAGSITAAQFLQHFVNEKKWAHLDIAGVAWNNKATPLSKVGATGFGVTLLNQFVKDNYEK